MRNNQPYSFHPHPSHPTTGGALRLFVTVRGALTLAEVERMINDLTAAVVDLTELQDCDALEIDPCIGIDENGTTTDYMHASDMERMPAADAGACAADIACWTVYGHLVRGGCVALLDFPTRHEAEGAAGLLSLFLGKPVDVTT